MGEDGHLYFHSPCFDGIVSCVLVWDFLETNQRWSIEEIHPVNYDARSSWLSTPLLTRAAVVDFLYHPEAQFWADHHLTTFLTNEAKADFEARLDPFLVYDPAAGSCAQLLWNHFAAAFGYRNPAYDDMVEWADKIDAARYASVEEAILGTQPDLTINLTLNLQEDQTYCADLVRLLRREPLDRVASLPEVKARLERAESLTRAGLERFVNAARLEDDGIAVFDVRSHDVIISRYAPYYVFPRARYSVGIVRSPDDVTITAMRNPWRQFHSVPLGKIFSEFGGGGHQRVAALVLSGDRVAEASLILNQIISDIRKSEVIP